MKRKRRGIVFEEFYRDVVYPFFANYHYKEFTEDYANGEYKHHFDDIAQFYQEEFGLSDFANIIALLETAINGIKYHPNRECPLCGRPKYKKCCRKKIYDLKGYGLQQLKFDLVLFRKYNLNAKQVSN